MISGIVLAAGFGRRIGRPKALLEIDGQTFHRRCVDILEACSIQALVITNADVEAALPAPRRLERRVLNPEPDGPSGMMGSVRLGVTACLDAGAAGVLILPVDHPFVTAADLGAVKTRLEGGADIVVPLHGGRRGHPIGLGPAPLREITDDPSIKTLRDVVRKDPARVVEVAASPGVLVGINTSDDLERASRRSLR